MDNLSLIHTTAIFPVKLTVVNFQYFWSKQEKEGPDCTSGLVVFSWKIVTAIVRSIVEGMKNVRFVEGLKAIFYEETKQFSLVLRAIPQLQLKVLAKVGLRLSNTTIVHRATILFLVRQVRKRWCVLHLPNNSHLRDKLYLSC